MTPEEVRFTLLSRLNECPELSQRDLARELGVSLGKVNYCLRALIDKGFVKTSNFRRSENKSAYLYTLTPSGIDEKVRQTRAFLQIKQFEYAMLKAEIDRLSTELKAADAGAAKVRAD